MNTFVYCKIVQTGTLKINHTSFDKVTIRGRNTSPGSGLENDY